jgi:hypothetical protein
MRRKEMLDKEKIWYFICNKNILGKIKDEKA